MLRNMSEEIKNLRKFIKIINFFENVKQLINSKGN